MPLLSFVTIHQLILCPPLIQDAMASCFAHNNPTITMAWLLSPTWKQAASLTQAAPVTDSNPMITAFSLMQCCSRPFDLRTAVNTIGHVWTWTVSPLTCRDLGGGEVFGRCRTPTGQRAMRKWARAREWVKERKQAWERMRDRKR